MRRAARGKCLQLVAMALLERLRRFAIAKATVMGDGRGGGGGSGEWMERGEGRDGRGAGLYRGGGREAERAENMERRVGGEGSAGYDAIKTQHVRAPAGWLDLNTSNYLSRLVPVPAESLVYQKPWNGHALASSRHRLCRRSRPRLRLGLGPASGNSGRATAGSTLCKSLKRRARASAGQRTSARSGAAHDPRG